MYPLRISLLIAVFVAAVDMPTATASAQGAEFVLKSDAGWQASRTPEPGSDEAIVAGARAAIAQDRPGAALSILNRWISDKEATGEANTKWMPEAVLLRGDALLALGREYSSLFEYERVARQYPASDAFVRAAEREFDIANRYLNGLRRRFLGFRVASATSIGEELLIRVQERLPGSQIAERAGILLADYYYRVRKMDLAAVSYDLYLQNYPRGEWRLHAMRRRIFANIGQFTGPSYDSTTLLDAREEILQFAAVYPNEAEDVSPIIARIDDSLAARKLDAARWYLRRGDPASARFTLRRLLRDHPRSTAASKAIQLLEQRGWLTRDSAPQAPAPSDAPAAKPANTEARSP